MLADELGIPSFGLRELTLQPGMRNRIDRHREQQKAFLVLRGRLTIVLDDGELELGEGEIAAVAPTVRRQLANRGDEPCIAVAIGAAGTHEVHDGEAFLTWDDHEPKRPSDVPFPE